MSIDEQIADLGLAADLAEALRTVASDYGPEIDQQPGYISVRPSDRYIAAYFNKNFVDVVVDPLGSQAAAVAHPGTRILPKKTSSTAYLRVPSKSIEGPALVALVGSAMAWREAGSGWTGASGAGFGADLAGEACETCWEEFAVNGACSCD